MKQTIETNKQTNNHTMYNTKIIRDPLYGDIIMSSTAIRLIDSDVYRRMADIKQTSMAWRVFPSARHSRMNHQIGVYGLAKRTIESLNIRRKLVITNNIQDDIISPAKMTRLMQNGILPHISEIEKEWICLGGLLHDLGHGPASHTFDKLINQFIEEGLIPKDCKWKTHEERSQCIFRELVDTEPDRFGLSPIAVDYICNIINPEQTFIHDFRFQFINNEVNGVDLDKIDYLERDRYVFGLPDKIDVDRIIDNSSICVDLKLLAADQSCKRNTTDHGTYWSFGERTRDDIFALFMTRYKLYRNIYNHPKIVCFELAYMNVLRSNSDIIVKAIIEEDITAFSQMTDEFMLWKASDKSRIEFGKRNTFRRINDNASEQSIQQFDSVIEFNETVGFFGRNGFNPFEHIRFHDRSSNCIIRLSQSDISIFLLNECHSETLQYRFGYTAVVV